ncbi:MAG: FKBP-type peptidyl-prolyl cis-trans isomerase [Pyrinomonadaceae bacterium]|nr:FKBP-type peptidyl-prolyl cis-trans isomerase [Phycisphaerales bacterium]
MRSIISATLKPAWLHVPWRASIDNRRRAVVACQTHVAAVARAIGHYRAFRAATLVSMMLLASCKSDTALPAGSSPAATASDTAPSPSLTDLPVVTSTGQKIDRVTLESGLVIEDLQRGTGPICLPTSTIQARYSCRVLGGKVFDSTGPLAVQYVLPTMIRGWQYGLPGMQVGGTRRLTIPPELGYGDRPLKDGEGLIVAPANSTLEYTIELVDVK